MEKNNQRLLQPCCCSSMQSDNQFETSAFYGKLETVVTKLVTCTTCIKQGGQIILSKQDWTLVRVHVTCKKQYAISFSLGSIKNPLSQSSMVGHDQAQHFNFKGW